MKYLLILFLLPILASGQLSENFNDGDFSTGIIWSGHTDKFKVNDNKQLQLYTSGESTSYLTCSLVTNEISEWNIWVKLAFAPSENNNALIYLVSDESELDIPLNGYFIKLGEQGSADAIELYRQVQNEKILVARGTEGFLKNAFDVRIKVTRDDGRWEIYADANGGNEFIFQASGEDDVWLVYNTFGLLCKYTQSNATKFYFDDVYAGPLILDNQPPSVKDLYVIDDRRIDIRFSEPVSSASASNLSNYTVDSDFGCPVACGIDANDPVIVHLLFQDSFIEDYQYNLLIKNICDNANNLIASVSLPFRYYKTRQFDILINELMVDPDPPVALPICEYIELYNRTSHKIRLINWHLQIGTSSKLLPNIVIEPYGFYLITAPGNDTLLSKYGPCTTVSGLQLSNTGALLVIKNNHDAVIHAVSYTNQYYRDKKKENGGWSLELIDPVNPCGSSDNWKASKNTKGGSPGAINSVSDSNPDLMQPFIDYVSVDDSSSVTIVFNEQMDTLTVLNPANYNISSVNAGSFSCQAVDYSYVSVRLKFITPLTDDIIYTLTYNEKLCDCAGNFIKNTLEKKFAIPDTASPNDIVFNEILCDPGTFGEEFIEIYNRSKKVISLKNLWLGVKDQQTHTVQSSYNLSPVNRLIFPGDYLVLTKDPDAVKHDYFTIDNSCFMKMTTMPILNNSGATLVLTDIENRVIDEVTYSDEMHFPLLNTTKGVSLERINYDSPSGDVNNWHSASQSVGFATPGYRNSQFLTTSGSKDNLVIEPLIFSPDNDGYNDITNITCNFSKCGYAVTVRIFDVQGHLIKTLASNHYSGERCSFNWNGLNDKGEKALTGNYIAVVEYYSTDGTTGCLKNVISLATQ